MAAIPCPIHCPKGWISFQKNHLKDDYHKSAAIAINCCAECEEQMSNWAKNLFKASSNDVVNSCEHENTRHHAPTDDRYCHDCKCMIEVAGKSVSPIPVAVYQTQRAKEFHSDMERIAQELDLPKDKSHIGYILLAICNLKEKVEKQ